MDIRKIRKLIELINETGIGEIEVKSGEDSVRISRQPTANQTVAMPQIIAAEATAAPAAAPTSTNPASAEPSNAAAATPKAIDGHHVKAPMVGTVYLAPTPGAGPFVSVGQHVTAGDTLCLIEAMKMFNKIEADKTGVISARLIENEQPVEYEQTLFIIEDDE